jgi:hypothetical protein
LDLLTHPRLVLLGRPASVHPIAGGEVIDVHNMVNLAAPRVDGVIHGPEVPLFDFYLLLDFERHVAIGALLRFAFQGC